MNRIAGSTYEAFAKDQRGSIIFVFAVMSALMMGMIGGSVDYGRWLSAKSKTLNAMDAAVLAGGRVLQLPGKTEADAVSAAQKYYAENKSNALYVDNTTFSVQNNEVVGTSTSSVKTPFLGAAGIKTLPVNVTSKAILAAGGNAGSHVEIAIMLDTTGSMGGQKMTDLKDAAKDLIDIVVWQDQSTYTSRVALAPFSEYVNVGTAYFGQITGETASGGVDQRTCVKERHTSKRYADKSPVPGHYFERYTGSGTCKPTSTIMPLSSDKVALKAKVDSFPTTGMTAGHLGTAWAWYLLSPKWKDIWPAASKPLAYNQISQPSDPNSNASPGDSDFVPKLYKIAILMTDGAYNRWYPNDHSPGNNDPDPDANSTTQARELCTKMKDKGIIVYTVGFGISVNSEPDVTMQQCATSSTHYYNASDGAALKQAFRDIAIKISELRLSQ